MTTPETFTMNSTTTDAITSDHPLFLHQTDHPGLILISKKLTGSDNYSSWKRSMVIALNAKNKMKLITGEFPEPTLNSVTRALWERNNDMLISWILNTVVEQISNNLNFIHSVSKLWFELQEQYSQIDGHRVYQLTQDLIQLKQLNCAVEVYYQKLKGFWDELDALEAPHLCVCPCKLFDPFPFPYHLPESPQEQRSFQPNLKIIITHFQNPQLTLFQNIIFHTT